MRIILLSFLLIHVMTISLFSQPNLDEYASIKKITPLKNKTYEIKEFTADSLLIYKGYLRSIDPEVRHGRYYFFNDEGRVEASGLYNQDYPYGTWVYYGKNNDTVEVIDYTTLWTYLESEAFNYSIDSSVLNKLKPKDKEFMNPDGTFSNVKKLPTFNNGDPNMEFSSFIENNIHYPIYAEKKNFSGIVVVKFIIDDKGYVRNPVIKESVSPDLDIEALRVISESPKWEPGEQKRLPVNVIYSWPISFYPLYTTDLSDLITDFIGIEILDTLNITSNEIGQLPLFQGNEWLNEFMIFTAQQLRYPEKDAERGISGRVIVEFNVMPDGSIDNINVIQSVSPGIDAEAIRVVKLSNGKWTPAKKDGENVKITLKVPISFVLQ